MSHHLWYQCRIMMHPRSATSIKLLPVAFGIAALTLGAQAQVSLDAPTLNAQTLSTQIGPDRGQSTVPTVTSDSPEYCGVLIDRISSIFRTSPLPPPNEATVLSEAGQWMCVHGQTRGGILRLRRAIAILNKGDN
jgi:hypothetical protein